MSVLDNVIFLYVVAIHPSVDDYFCVVYQSFRIFNTKIRGTKRNVSVALAARFRVRVMVFNATFNRISVISRGSVLLVEETGVLGENHRPAESH